MKRVDFRMERPGLVKVGDEIEVSEYPLKTIAGTVYYYTMEPAVAMSGNLPAKEKLNVFHGVVTEVTEKESVFTVYAEFED